MIRHTQSLIGPNGNCLQTAIESVLNLPLGTLPPQAHPVAYYYRVLNNFLTTLEWHYRNVAPGAMLAPGWHVLIGASPRTAGLEGKLHATVGYNGRLAWDPHPSRAGLVDVRQWGILDRVAC